MFTHRVAIAALSAITVVSAQNGTFNPFTLPNPASVDIGTRVSWCTAENNACGNLCQSVIAQSCDEVVLSYTCTCSNNQSPDMTQYMNTLPWFICKENFKQCIDSNPNDATAQKACTANIDNKCGTKNTTGAIPLDASSAAPSSSSATLFPSATTPTGAPTTAPTHHSAAASFNMQQAVSIAVYVAIGAMVSMF